MARSRTASIREEESPYNRHARRLRDSNLRRRGVGAATIATPGVRLLMDTDRAERGQGGRHSGPSEGSDDSDGREGGIRDGDGSGHGRGDGHGSGNGGGDGDGSGDGGGDGDGSGDGGGDRDGSGDGGGDVDGSGDGGGDVDGSGDGGGDGDGSGDGGGDGGPSENEYILRRFDISRLEVRTSYGTATSSWRYTISSTVFLLTCERPKPHVKPCHFPTINRLGCS